MLLKGLGQSLVLLLDGGFLVTRHDVGMSPTLLLVILILELPLLVMMMLPAATDPSLKGLFVLRLAPGPNFVGTLVMALLPVMVTVGSAGDGRYGNQGQVEDQGLEAEIVIDTKL